VRENSQITSNLFLANASNAAQMHFDGDHRHVLLYQVFGRKRAFVVPATSSMKMLTVLNQCWHNFSTMSEQEKQEFIAYVDGYECTLHPGDTLYFPMMAWHHLDYLDTGMSVNFRFGRSRYSDDIYKYMHADKYVQNVASILDYDKPPGGVDTDAVFQRIRAELKAFCPDPNEKFWQVRRLIKQIFSEICVDSASVEKLLSGEEEIIKSSRALSALTAQPYHVSNWLRLNDLHDPMMRILADAKEKNGPSLEKPKGVTATL
jgi:lysine-specific demethylase 8